MWLLVGLLSAGCQSADVTTTAPMTTGTPRNPVVYQTRTPLPPTPTGTPVYIPPVTPAPTMTPYMHIVAQGETMLGIALQYAVSLEELQAANPGVDPQFLSVGTGLTIPLGGEIQQAVPTATPVDTTWYAPVCYRTGDGGAWCFLLVENDGPTTLENLSAWIGLYDMNGTVVVSQIAVGPLNILRPGQAMPLVVFFDPPLPAELTASGELITAVELDPEDTRYLDWPVSIDDLEISGVAMDTANVSGSIELPEDSAAPGSVWILAVAYDQDGSVVGVRKWEGSGDLAFDIRVYSLGGAIQQVEVLVEVRP